MADNEHSWFNEPFQMRAIDNICLFVHWSHQRKGIWETRMTFGEKAYSLLISSFPWLSSRPNFFSRSSGYQETSLYYWSRSQGSWGEDPRRKSNKLMMNTIVIWWSLVTIQRQETDSSFRFRESRLPSVDVSLPLIARDSVRPPPNLGNSFKSQRRVGNNLHPTWAGLLTFITLVLIMPPVDKTRTCNMGVRGKFLEEAVTRNVRWVLDASPRTGGHRTRWHVWLPTRCGTTFNNSKTKLEVGHVSSHIPEPIFAGDITRLEEKYESYRWGRSRRYRCWGRRYRRVLEGLSSSYVAGKDGPFEEDAEWNC